MSFRFARLESPAPTALSRDHSEARSRASDGIPALFNEWVIWIRLFWLTLRFTKFCQITDSFAIGTSVPRSAITDRFETIHAACRRELSPCREFLFSFNALETSFFVYMPYDLELRTNIFIFHSKWGWGS